MASPSSCAGMHSKPVDVNIPILLIIFMLGHVLSQQWYIFNIFGNFFISVLFLTDYLYNVHKLI